MSHPLSIRLKEARGQERALRYGWHPTPFGACLIGIAGNEICHLSFLNRRSKRTALKELERVWPQATFKHDAAATGTVVAKLFGRRKSKDNINVLARGTPFQMKVWETTLKIPPGKALSYQEVASRTGNPQAARAVGSALARNSVGYLIPCHRVIHQTGVVGNYRWGSFRKRAMLAWESARQR